MLSRILVTSRVCALSVGSRPCTQIRKASAPRTQVMSNCLSFVETNLAVPS